VTPAVKNFTNSKHTKIQHVLRGIVRIRLQTNRQFYVAYNFSWRWRLTSRKLSAPGTASFRRIRQVRRLVGQDVAYQLVSAFILSRLDYCNSVLSRLLW